MRTLTELRGINYGLLEREDIGDMARVLGDVFSRRDPPAIAVGMSASDIERFVGIFGPKALADDLTIVARNSSGELVGAMFTEDFGTPPPADVIRVPASFAPVGALLDSLDDEYRATHPVVPGSHLHLFMVGVSDSFGGAGIAQTMITLCLTNAARRGYRLAVTEATGRTSQHIFRKLGFQDVCRRSYDQFLYDARRVFESIAAHGGTVLMERSIDGAGAA
jgi:ribosomal protein S18 acetylase RimI-like enzyme